MASTPITAPSVLQAYSGAIEQPAWPSRAVTRSIAGSVAPMAAVAGSSKKKLPKNATDHCHRAPGCVPVKPSIHSLMGAISSASARLHRAISSSQPAYQRSGRALASMRRPSTSAPTPSPAKNAVTTASTAAASWPSHSANCCVHTIW